jgi:WD40 repeat protein
VANLHWAWQAWHSGKLDQARDYLAQLQPDPGAEDHRGFGWYYLRGLCDNPCTVLSGHSGPVYSLAFSPDSATLVSGGTDHQLVHWDIATGRTRATWDDFPDDVNSICFSPDGQLIATGGEERRVRIWDAISGQVRQSFTEFGRPIAGVFFAPDGTHLFATEIAWAENWGYTSLWNLTTGQQQAKCAGRAFALSPDGHTVLLHRGLWHWAAEGQQGEPDIAGPRLPGSVLAAAYSPDGRTVASSGREPRIHVQTLPGRETVATLRWHASTVRALDFSPDGSLLASGSDDGRVFLWDTTSWDLQAVLSGDGHRIWVVTFSPDGNRLAAGCDDGQIRMWDPTAARARSCFPAELPMLCSLGFLSNEELVVAGSPERSSCAVWNIATGRQVRSFELPGEKIDSLAATPSAPWLALGTAGGTVHLVDRGSGALRCVFPVDAAGQWLMRQVVFSPDGRYLAGARTRSATADDPRWFLVSVWDVASGEELWQRTFRRPQGAAHAQPFAFSPDSQTLALPCEDQVYLCDAASGTRRLLPIGPLERVWSVAFSPDGNWLALGTHDWLLHLVEPHDAARHQTMVGTRGIAGALAFSPDGRILVSGSSSGEITLWDVQTGDEVYTLEGPSGTLQWLDFAPDGTRLVAIKETREGCYQIHVWHAPAAADP